MLNVYKKIFVGALVVMVAIGFSGCSISKVDKESNTDNNKGIIVVDSDGDGLFDDEEQSYKTNVYKADSDGDGLSDYDEIRNWKTDPNKADTDGDGYKDGEEIAAGYDPLTLGQLDTDSDGLGNATEKKLGTDPNKFDTDSDGLSDKEEIDMQKDPLRKN